ncbi:MAG: NAD(P)H-hydrate dehydratase [Bacteroidales bacterium]|nr:NAD(P)H-hydrate dehydratase [Bacteroidales bacterium]
MKVFTTEAIRHLDKLTIKREGITSTDLMDRAAMALFHRLRTMISPTDKVMVMAGPGNNGGDGLVVGKWLYRDGFRVTVVMCRYGKSLSPDAALQLERLKQEKGLTLLEPADPQALNDLEPANIVLDALFGSGLNRPLEGPFADTVNWMNSLPAKRIAIDLPSGLFGEDNGTNPEKPVIKADVTYCLQQPRLACLLPENEPFIGQWQVVDIGLNNEALAETDTPWSLTSTDDAALLLKPRPPFAHKGHFGHSLLIAGSPGMMGAALLAGRGALRTGTGLLTLRVPASCLPIVQTALPEALCTTYEGPCWSNEQPIEAWSAIGVGPGLGQSNEAAEGLKALIQSDKVPLVLDADALNILARDPDLFEYLPPKSILTPHPGEFDRLWGRKAANGYERLQAATEMAVKAGIYIVLKGAYTACISPDGRCHFNSTGHPGMATGGSGDVLTGIIVSLLAQGYGREEACILGTCLHGLSAELALDTESVESLIASDIANHLGKAFKQLTLLTHS